MIKQDMNGVRKPEDIERKYNLADLIKTVTKNYEISKNGLNKVENELDNYIKAITKNLNELQDQVDGNITTWFYNGVPTLESEPAKNWNTDKEKNNHLGDLYYDQDTGYAYRWAYVDNKYIWSKIVDADVVKALALANAAQDTADRKRQTFISQPIPPYDVGDSWIKDGEILICQTSKSAIETFEENDWIDRLKYTDDTKANQVGENLTILSGTVTEIRNDVDSLSNTMTNTTELVNEQGDKIGNLQVQQSQVTQTVNNYDIYLKNVQKSLETTNGTVQTLGGIITDMNFNFSTKGLNIGTSTDPNSSLFDNKGIKVYNYEKLNAIFNNKGSGIDKLIVTGTAQLGYLKFVKSIKKSKKVTKLYHLKNLIEDLKDLEVQ